MNILIVEDEDPAAQRLQKQLQEIVPEARVLDVLASVASTVNWLKTHASPDLILMDINLADGTSFEVFSQVDVSTPVIFITAFDEYAIQAFQVNSVEYLLKPVRKEQLAAAINKYKRFHTGQKIDMDKIMESMGRTQDKYQKRFIIRFGEHIKAIDVKDVAYFYTEEKINFLKTWDDRVYPLDFNLDKLETMLDPERFFRINRQFIISIESINEMFSFSKSRVKVTLNPPTNMDTIVSTERSPNFKEWLVGKA